MWFSECTRWFDSNENVDVGGGGEAITGNWKLFLNFTVTFFDSHFAAYAKMTQTLNHRERIKQLMFICKVNPTVLFDTEELKKSICQTEPISLLKWMFLKKIYSRST